MRKRFEKRKCSLRRNTAALCVGAVFIAPWFSGCGGGSGGTGFSLGDGLPVGGGGGPDGGGGGGGNGGNVPIPPEEPACGGGTLSAVFTASTANANTTTFNATKVRGNALVVAGDGSSFSIIGTLCNPPAAGNRTLNIKINDRLAAGGNYILRGGSTGPGNSLQYLESAVSDGETTEKSWTATTGTLVVQSINGQSVTFRIQGAAMAPDPDFFTTNATGTFTLNVTGTVQTMNGLQAP